MKPHLLSKIVMELLSFTVFSLVLLFVTQQSIAQTVTANTQSTNNGFFYSFWNDFASGSASMTLGAAGNYSTTWTNIGNFTAGKGWATGKADRVICFSGTFDGGSNGFLAIYGWTKNELIEYYVVENYGSWTPPGGTSLGTFTTDGGTYNVYKTQRVQQPSIIGTATFYQYWSVRTTKRSSGTVTFANHVAAWKAKGMNMGSTWDYQILESEGYHSSGSSNVTVSECSTPVTPAVTISAPASNSTSCAGTAITITALPTITSGSIAKVEFYDGTTLLGTSTASPYSYSWANATAGAHTIGVVATSGAGVASTKVTGTITVNASPASPTVSTPVSYCQGATATALTASGTALKWYTVATGGTALTSAPVPSTTATGTTTYYVSQTANACEGSRASVAVTINAVPAAPTVTTPVNYTQNASAAALTATGTALKWYTVATGGTASTTAPTPITTTVGTTYYYVSQTTNACESPRATIAVVVAQTCALVTGWNIIGCPITGSTSIEKALSSIWSQVETVKSLDAFYSIENQPFMNSLTTVEWGEGYLVKVKANCILDWTVK